jgi:hypothetical protein
VLGERAQIGNSNRVGLQVRFDVEPMKDQRAPALFKLCHNPQPAGWCLDIAGDHRTGGCFRYQGEF